MKATGIVRRVDELGRIVIPKELRRTLGIDEGAPMEIYVDEDKVIFKKYQPGCIFCGNVHVRPFKDKLICESCASELSK